MSDRLGLTDTSIALNSALITLDGVGTHGTNVDGRRDIGPNSCSDQPIR